MLPVGLQAPRARLHDRTPAERTRAADTVPSELPPPSEVERCFAYVDHCRPLVGRDERDVGHDRAFRPLAIGFWSVHLALK
jgi:hypothetical protein